MRTLNLGILAHVDAGKTSLTERLLYAAGVIDEIGSVDDGSTQTDSLALERQRGITIKSAVVSFVLGDVRVNLIDTPGHPDFIAEVERALGVLDGAVLVISAVEGVQVQTRILMRALRRLGIPTLIFVNKIDRGGAQADRLVPAVAAKLTPAVVALGTVAGLGTRAARPVPYGPGDAGFAAGLADLLADHDDTFLAAYLDAAAPIPYRRLRAELAAQTGRARVHPVFFGSAATGAGVDWLAAGLTELLPAAEPVGTGPVSGTVFKVERGPAGEKIAYARLFGGTVQVRDRVCFGAGKAGKVTAIGGFDGGSAVARGSVSGGEIGTLWGLGDVQIGDPLGLPPPDAGRHQFAPPTLETVVVPARRADRGALHGALRQLAEQDPLINLRPDDVAGELSVSLYGEVQKEVIQATLATEYGLAVSFRETTTICVERPAGTGAAVELIGTPDNPFAGTVGLRVEPAPGEPGVAFRLAVELGSLPLSFMAAVEETVQDALRQGLYGWQVTGCLVTMTQSGYYSPISTAGDFRNLTPLVALSALRRAGTVVYEPVHRFRLDVPADLLGAVLPVLARVRAVPHATVPDRDGYRLDGQIPAAGVPELERQLPSVTRGEGVLEAAFDHYAPVRGQPPTRPRSDHNPLDRAEYLLRVLRRVPGHSGGPE